jgi:hypothetical protein
LLGTYYYNFTIGTVSAFQFEYEDWLVEQCGLEKIEEWRKVIHLTARTKVSDQPESYRDKWDDDHLLAQAHNDFTQKILTRSL